jgi:hypothetical protein
MAAHEGPSLDGYLTYLRAELGKFGNVAEASALLASARCEAAVWLPATPKDLAKSFRTTEQIDAYLARLSRKQLIGLANCLSNWRRNNVASTLAATLSTEYIDVPVASILLSAAEPELHEAFARNAWSLSLIAADPEVLKADAYRDRSPGGIVRVPICLARPERNDPGTFRVVDGMHRAIQLVRNGHVLITLCIMRDS